MIMLLDRKQYFYLYDFSADAILDTYYKHFHELFFCQRLGLAQVISINPPLWYLSILIYGGALLYSILKNFQGKATSIIIPCLCLFGFPFLLSNGNCTLENELVIHGIQTSMLRGVVDMRLGIMTGVFIEHNQETLNRNIFFLNVISIFSLVGIILQILAQGNYDYLILFFSPIMIVTFCTKGSIFQILFKQKIWEQLGSLSMYMYFIHLFVLYFYWIFIYSYVSSNKPFHFNSLLSIYSHDICCSIKEIVFSFNK